MGRWCLGRFYGCPLCGNPAKERPHGRFSSDRRAPSFGCFLLAGFGRRGPASAQKCGREAQGCLSSRTWARTLAAAFAASCAKHSGAEPPRMLTGVEACFLMGEVGGGRVAEEVLWTAVVGDLVVSAPSRKNLVPRIAREDTLSQNGGPKAPPQGGPSQRGPFGLRSCLNCPRQESIAEVENRVGGMRASVKNMIKKGSRNGPPKYLKWSLWRPWGGQGATLSPPLVDLEGPENRSIFEGPLGRNKIDGCWP